MIRISKLPAWQRQLIRKEVGRRKLLTNELYEAIIRLNQFKYETKKEKPHGHSNGQGHHPGNDDQ